MGPESEFGKGFSKDDEWIVGGLAWRRQGPLKLAARAGLFTQQDLRWVGIDNVIVSGVWNLARKPVRVADLKRTDCSSSSKIPDAATPGRCSLSPSGTFCQCYFCGRRWWPGGAGRTACNLRDSRDALLPVMYRTGCMDQVGLQTSPSEKMWGIKFNLDDDVESRENRESEESSTDCGQELGLIDPQNHVVRLFWKIGGSIESPSTLPLY